MYSHHRQNLTVVSEVDGAMLARQKQVRAHVAEAARSGRQDAETQSIVDRAFSNAAPASTPPR